MGANYSQETSKLNYYDLSNILFKIEKRYIEEKADFIKDEKEKEEFLNSKNKELVKKEYTKHSTLGVSFSSHTGIKFLDKLKERIIPEIKHLKLFDVSDSPGRFEKFMSVNFPIKTDNLEITGKGMSLREAKLTDISHIFLQRISNSIRLSNFVMTTSNLKQLLNLCRNLITIDFQGCSLMDSFNLELEDKFHHLESLNLEGIGLSQRNIETVVMYLINNKIISHMKYINLFHKGMENLLLDLESRLLQNGYKGFFKKVSDWARFTAFLRGIYLIIKGAIMKVYYFLIKVLLILLYPLIFIYKKLFKNEVD